MPRWLSLSLNWGIAGLTASAGMAGWVEFALLRRGLAQKIGRVSLPAVFTIKLWIVAFVAALFGYGCKVLFGTGHPRLLAAFVVPLFGAIYFSGAALLNIPESRTIINSVLRRFRR